MTMLDDGSFYFATSQQYIIEKRLWTLSFFLSEYSSRSGLQNLVIENRTRAQMRYVLWMQITGRVDDRRYSWTVGKQARMRRGMDLVRCYRVCHRAISEYSLACETAIIANVATDEDWTYLVKSSYSSTENSLYLLLLYFCMRGHAMCHADENTLPVSHFRFHPLEISARFRIVGESIWVALKRVRLEWHRHSNQQPRIYISLVYMSRII